MDSAEFTQFLHGDRIELAKHKSTSLKFAQHLDSTDPLAHFRDEFLIPSKADLREEHPEQKPLEAQNGTSRGEMQIFVTRTEEMQMLLIHPSTSAETPSGYSQSAPAG